MKEAAGRAGIFGGAGCGRVVVGGAVFGGTLAQHVVVGDGATAKVAAAKLFEHAGIACALVFYSF